MRGIAARRGFVAAVVLTLAAVAPSHAADPPKADYPMYDGVGVTSMITGADGRLWFSQKLFQLGPPFPIGWIAAMDRLGHVTEYGVNDSGPGRPDVYNFSVAPDGRLWFVDSANRALGNITTAGAATRVALAAGYPVYPVGLAAARDGTIWYLTDGGGGPDAVVRSTPDGTVLTTVPLPYTSVRNTGIAEGADGNMWFIDNKAQVIDRITPSGVITPHEFPSRRAAVEASVIAGPDGNIWYSRTFTDDREPLAVIGKVTPGGVISEYPVPQPDSFVIPAAGPDGNIWYADNAYSSVGRVTGTGVITRFPQPCESHPAQLTSGPGGDVWFYEAGGLPSQSVPRGPHGLSHISPTSQPAPEPDCSDTSSSGSSAPSPGPGQAPGVANRPSAPRRVVAGLPPHAGSGLVTTPALAPTTTPGPSSVASALPPPSSTSRRAARHLVASPPTRHVRQGVDRWTLLAALGALAASLVAVWRVRSQARHSARGG
jgi:virginiamycin B lyase